MRENQRTSNPYPYSDSNKRYQTFDYYLRRLFGEKCAKVSLDAGFTCPNIDGKVSTGGCIYCSGGSSGAECEGSLSEQYERGREIMTAKWKCDKFIPYLQAHTNTYAEPEVLRRVYGEAASQRGAVMLAIATRADCLGDEVLEVLRKTAQRIPLMIELGLQSVSDETARRINRGHTFEDFKDGYYRLRDAIPSAKIAVHLINGLPGEGRDDMINSAVTIAALRPDVVKFHVLQVQRGTPLAKTWEDGGYRAMEQDEYVGVVCDQIERIAPDCAVGRICGDTRGDGPLAPLWCQRKTAVANCVDRELYRRGTYQGIYFGQ